MVIIEKMSREHIPELAEIEQLCFAVPWSEKQLLEELENPLGSYFVAVEDGRILGYIGSQTVIDETCVMNVAVRPDCRGKRLGSLLMEALVQDCLEKGSRLLTLEVRVSNEPALALYRAFGFQQVGLRKGYYEKPREDAIIMTKFFQEDRGQDK